MDPVSDILSLPVLSIRQPWASLVVCGVKTLELRTWWSRYRGWMWIHCARHVDRVAMRQLQLDEGDFDFGGIIGLAHLSTCHRITAATDFERRRVEHRSAGCFVDSCFGWVLSDSISLDRIIECRGFLGLFRLSMETQRTLKESLDLRRYIQMMATPASKSSINQLDRLSA